MTGVAEAEPPVALAEPARAMLGERARRRVLRSLRRPLRRVGVDAAQVDALLDLDATLHERAPRPAEKGFVDRLARVYRIGPMGVLGLIFGAVAGAIADPFPAICLFGTFVLMIVATAVMLDGAARLVDVEREALATLPVGRRTRVTALAVRTAISGLRVAAPMTLCGAAACASFRGPAMLLRIPLASAALVGAAIPLAALGAAAIRPLARRRPPPGVGLALRVAAIVGLIALLVAMKTIGPLLRTTDLAAETGTFGTIAVALYPPAHGAALATLDLNDAPFRRGLALAAVLAPFALAAAALASALRSATTSQGTSASASATPAEAGGWSRPAGAFLARWLAPEPDARAGFDFALRLAQGDRSFLRKLPAAWACVIVWPVVELIRRRESSAAGGHEMWAPFTVYATAAACSLLVHAARFTDHAAASWSRAATPLGESVRFRGGATSAVLVAACLPAVLAAAAIALVLGGLGATVEIAVAVELSLAALLVIPIALRAPAPFSEPTPPVPSRGAAVEGIALMVAAAGLLAVAHLLLRRAPWGMEIAAVALVPALAGLHLFLRRSGRA